MSRSGVSIFTRPASLPASGSGSPSNHAASTATASSKVRQRPRKKNAEKQSRHKLKEEDPETEKERERKGEEEEKNEKMPSWTARNQWVVLALASGACAACNGVFAKLTTNDLTTHIARSVSGLFGLADLERFVEVVVRASFFGLNLVFNGVMWTLFTKALARGHSTTQVSIMNTSANFVLTALLGLAIFAEALPPLWWAGAALLVAGNVIIGRERKRDDDHADDDDNADLDASAEDGDGDGDGDEVDDAVAAAELGRARSAGYGAVMPAGNALPVEKNDEDGGGAGVVGVEARYEDEDEDEDVPLIGDVS
ncbi:hypothetical protein AAE478_001537 [Parahypoxylon ruwenzoriense]